MVNVAPLIQLLKGKPAIQAKIAALWGQPKCSIYLKQLLNLELKSFESSEIIVLANLVSLHDTLYPNKI